LGRKYQEIVVLDADLSKSTKSALFAKEFPERFFNFGIAEANMVGTASGLAASGKIPFCSSFACFLLCRAYDQIRMCVAFPELNVKLVGSHGGITVGEDGASQHAIEDIALATSLPGFTVIVPADEFATRALVEAAALYRGPVYIRLGRPRAPIVYDENSQFEIGKAVILREGRDCTIIANGFMVIEALEAAEALMAEGLEAGVIDMHTVKPLDEVAVERAARQTGAIVTAEEHQIWGGLGSAVARVLARRYPVPMEFVAINDTYAESGKPEELLKKYGLTAADIARAVRKVVQVKTVGRAAASVAD